MGLDKLDRQGRLANTTTANNDELVLFDSIASFPRHGDLNLNPYNIQITCRLEVLPSVTRAMRTHRTEVNASHQQTKMAKTREKEEL
jgi:hypothetical protein